ncbi:MAG: hypothetical protein QW835_05855 [Candidatus Hadarchaeum sp.]
MRLLEMLGLKEKGKDKPEKREDGWPSVQEFLSFVDIQDGLIMLPGNRYRMIVEVRGGLNFSLMKEAEQDQVEASFRKFLRGLTGTVELFTHTRPFDTNDHIKNIRSMSLLQEMAWLADLYIQDLDSWAKNRTISVREGYVIIGYESADLEEAKREILRRIDVLLQEFGGWLGMRVLGTQEAADLLYRIMNKERVGIMDVEDMVAAGHLAPVVRGLSLADFRKKTEEE